MAVKFLHRALRRTRSQTPGRVALLPGAWNPPTVAHVAMARAALSWADEVVLVIPGQLPHKQFAGVSFEDRAAILSRLAAAEEGFSAGITDSGLYFRIAAEATDALRGAEIGLVCGRDAAERIAAWDYGEPGVFEEMIRRHPLLVASRSGLWQPAGLDASHVVHLPLEAGFDAVSSTEVRRLILAGEEWKPLVPESIHADVARLYGSRG